MERLAAMQAPAVEQSVLAAAPQGWQLPPRRARSALTRYLFGEATEEIVFGLSQVDRHPLS